MNKSKPIDLMRLYFGESEETCGTCCNLAAYQYGSKKVRKCMAYGGLHSSKADWAKHWPACGLHGKKVIHQMVSNAAKAIFTKAGVVDKAQNDISDAQMEILDFSE